jgi:hypothetical protein
VCSYPFLRFVVEMAHFDVHLKELVAHRGCITQCRILLFYSNQTDSGFCDLFFSKILSRVVTKTIVMWWSLKQSTVASLKAELEKC